MTAPTIPQHIVDRLENEWKQVAPAPRPEAQQQAAFVRKVETAPQASA